MSWRCELTGKGPLVGHKVSHSNIKTKRRFRRSLPCRRNKDLTKSPPQDDRSNGPAQRLPVFWECRCDGGRA